MGTQHLVPLQHPGATQWWLWVQQAPLPTPVPHRAQAVTSEGHGGAA